MKKKVASARKIGFPVLICAVLRSWGRAMEIVENETITLYMRTAVKASPDHPVLLILT